LGIELLGERLNDWSELPRATALLTWVETRMGALLAMDDDRLSCLAGCHLTSTSRSEQFVMHDFAGPSSPEVNEPDVVKSLDIAAANPYHGTQDHSMVKGLPMSGITFRRSRKQITDHRNQC